MEFMKSILIAFSLISIVSAASCPVYTVQVIQGTSSDAAGLTPVVDAYRALLGGIDNGNNAGPFGSGQRSINWDADIVPFNMPGIFFRDTVTRGLALSSSDGQFRVSNPPSGAPGSPDDRFDSINPVVSSQFVRFSGARLFTALRTVTNGRFTVPGLGGGPATVSGFGSVFTDVENFGRTFITYFDRNGCIIFRLNILTRSGGLSFGGIRVLTMDGRPTDAPIFRIRINMGNRSILRRRGDIGQRDIVVADDFIYGEPQPL